MDMEEQLMSYLNQLHLSVGVLVCKCLYIYCYNYVEKKIKKVEIQFTKDNLDGIEFVELFQKENFDKEKIETFINNKLSFGENIKKIKNEITLNIKSILKEYFSHSHLYTENEINDALKDVEIKTEGNIISLLLNKNVKTCSLGNIEKIKDKITLENVSFLLKTYFSGVFTEDETNKALKDIRVDIVQANQHESKEIKLPQNPHMLKVGDCIEARTHYEFLNKVFGKNYKLWGSCVWKFDSDTIVWMVRFNKVCDGWRNTFLTKDCIMEENLEAKPDWKGTKVENEPTLRMRRVVIEIDGKSYNRRYIFKGVFKYDQERSDPYSIRYHNKIADDFYF